MSVIHLVALLALLQYLFFGALVGQARVRRAHVPRVQTLEGRKEELDRQRQRSVHAQELGRAPGRRVGRSRVQRARRRTERSRVRSKRRRVDVALKEEDVARGPLAKQRAEVRGRVARRVEARVPPEHVRGVEARRLKVSAPCISRPDSVVSG